MSCYLSEFIKKILDKKNSEAISFLAQCKLPIFDQNQTIKRGTLPKKDDLRNVQTSKSEMSSYSGGGSPEAGMHDTRERVKPQPVHVEKEVGRNEPCPCGSGKKFKQCHGRK